MLYTAVSRISGAPPAGSASFIWLRNTPSSCAQPLNRAAALGVHAVGAELYRNALQMLKRVLQD